MNTFYTTILLLIEYHLFVRAIWDKLPECVFENFEIGRVKRGQFQNFKKSRG